MSRSGALQNPDILFHIFTAFYRTGWEYDHGPFETNYTRGLHPLAAVSRAWRHAAMDHFLLKHLTLEVTKPPRRGRHAGYFQQLFAQPPPVLRNMGPYGHVKTNDALLVYHTNAHVIPHANNRATSLYIYLGNNVTTNDLLTALEQIGFERYRLPEVTALSLVTDRMYVPGVANDSAIREPLYHKLNSIGVAVDWIFRMAPRISSVKLGSRSKLPYPMQIPLQASIMDNVAQLSRLEISNQFCSFTIPPLFPPLAVLSICPVHHTLNFVLAKIAPGCLQKLRLYQINPRHFIETIGAADTDDTVVFPELVSLDLQFTAVSTGAGQEDIPSHWHRGSRGNSSAPGCQSPLQFPKLRIVYIHNYYYDISGIFPCFQQSPLHTLHFSTHPWVYLNAGIHRLTQLRRIWLTFETRLPRALPDDFFRPLFEMRSTALTDLTFYSSLNIVTTPLTHMLLGHLRTLDLDIRLGYDQIIGFMRQLPFLVNLRFILDIATVDRTSPALELFQKDLAPCSRSVQHMVVVFSPIVTDLGNEPSSLAVLDNMLLLTAHMPCLGRLRTSFSAALFKSHLRRAMSVRQFASKGAHLLLLKYTCRKEC